MTRGWSQAELAERAGVKANTISAIETAKGTARRATLARVDRALSWRPGSGERVLDGGEPEPVGHAPGDSADEQALALMRRRAALAAAREAIEAEIAELDGELEIRNTRGVE